MVRVKNETRSYYEDIVRRAVDDVAASLDEALDLGALAKKAAISPLHFQRIFRGAVGETPLELHRRLRMERAAHELAKGDSPVTRVAFEAGYETHESFTRAFKEAWGEPPSAFRVSAREGRCGHKLVLHAMSGIHFYPNEKPTWVMKGDIAMQVDVKEMAEIRLFAVRHNGPYMQIGEAFQRLHEIASKHALQSRPGTRMIAIFHDDPESTPPAQLRSDAGLSVTPDQKPIEGLSEIEIPEGYYATTIHHGPYENLPQSWAELMGKWLPSSGHRVGTGPSFEVYRNTPMDTKPADLETELYVPLAR